MKEEDKAMKFGGIDLVQHISPSPSNISKKRKAELEKSLMDIQSLVSEARQNPINVEEEPLKILEKKRKSLLRELKSDYYRELDLSFLSMSNQVEHSYGKISLPKFGVYRYVHFGDLLEGFDDFCVEFQFDLYSKRANIAFGNRFNRSKLYKFQDAESLVKHLVKGSDFCKEGLTPDFPDFNSYDPSRFISFENVQEKLIERMVDRGENIMGIREVTFKSEFKGLIPLDVKNKINEAKDIFGFKEYKEYQYQKRENENTMWRRYNVFLIGEVEPKSWTHTDLFRDPLLVGKEGDRFYLIEKFNTTPLENYVSREFSS